MSKIEVDNIDTVTGTTELTIGGTNATSITLGSGASFSNVSGQNYPAFKADRGTSNQTGIATDTWTKIQYNNEIYDTDGAYDNSTNYRFTVPTGKAGKYYFQAAGSLNYGGNTYTAQIRFLKNGTDVRALQRFTTGLDVTVFTQTVEDLSVGDYIEVQIRHNRGIDRYLVYNDNTAYFSGYRIGS